MILRSLGSVYEDGNGRQKTKENENVCRRPTFCSEMIQADDAKTEIIVERRGRREEEKKKIRYAKGKLHRGIGKENQEKVEKESEEKGSWRQQRVPRVEVEGNC